MNDKHPAISRLYVGRDDAETCTGFCHTPAQIIARAHKEIAEAEAEIAKAAEIAALTSRIEQDLELALATSALLIGAKDLLLGNNTHGTSARMFAKLRKELAPLAESYGVKIVLVGDKTSATLVKA